MPDYHKIKERLDYADGGRLHAFAQKAKAIDAPVLIIGLGGTGVQTLRRVKKLINDTIESEVVNGKKTDKPSNIEYMGFDTDKSERTKSIQGIRLEENRGEIVIHELTQAVEALSHPQQLNASIRTWLDTNVDPHNVIDGAGAIRQLGRLLLMQNIGDIKNLIATKIQNVVKGYPNTRPLYVFVISGISGGTGSGTFLDIPYLVRSVAAQYEVGRPVSVVGVLFMPDVNALNAKDEVSKNSLYTNGFAALKELDYVTSIRELGDVFQQKYADLDTDMLASSEAKDGLRAGISPFNICLLMSSKDKSGATPQGLTNSEAYEQIKQVAAETVFNFVVGDDNAKSDADFSIRSYLSNENKNVNYYKTLLGESRHPVNYVFSIAGASSAVLPMDDIMSYLTYKAFKQVQEMYDTDPTDKDVDRVMDFFGISESKMMAGIKQGLHQPNLSKVSYDIVKKEPHRVVILFENMLKANSQIMQENLKQMLEGLQKALEDDNNIINTYFRDLARGPIFAQHCLFRSDQNLRCVINDLRRSITRLKTNPGTSPQAMQAATRATQEALTKVRDSALIFGKESRLQDYLQAISRQYMIRTNQEACAYLIDFCEQASDIFRKKNNEIFEMIVELLTTLTSIFNEYAGIKNSAVKSKSGNLTTFSWQLVEAPQFIQELETRMENNPDFNVNLEDVVAHFYDYLLKNTDLWAGRASGDMVEEINDFIYNEFAAILDRSMEEFLGILAASSGYTSLEEYCKSIVHSLQQRSQVRFPIGGMTGDVGQPTYSFVSIPRNCPTLREIAIQETTVANSEQANSIVKESGIRNRIFMMTFMSATPLSACLDMKQFYSAYAKNVDDKKNGAGLHLFSKTSDSNLEWKYLPSPYPETEWGSFRDQRDHLINEKYREVLKKALDYGYVQEDELSKSMTLRWGTPIDVDGIVDKYHIDLSDDATSIPKDQAVGALDELNEQISNLDGRCRTKITRPGLITENGKIRKPYEEIFFIQMFKPRDQVAAMVENHEKALKAVANIDKRKLSDDDISRFVACLVYDLIHQSPDSILDYLYEDERGFEQGLLKLTPKTAKYREHYLMKAFRSVEASRYLSSEAEARIQRGATPQEVEKLKKLVERVDEKISDLKYNYKKIDDGEEILTSYQTMRNNAQDLLDLFDI